MMDAQDIGKLFVGGLSWETTQENLQSYFSCFGEVSDCVVLKNNETGRSRGFGFVTFKDPNCVAAVLRAKPHQLNGRTVDTKECLPRHMQKNVKSSAQGKIFLGGLPPNITEGEIRDAMSRFGNVSEVLIMYDSETNKCRGFGFISFESEDSIELACAEHFVDINGKQVECKRAQSKNNPRQNVGQKNMWNMIPENISNQSYGDVLSSRYETNWYPTTQPLQNILGSSYIPAQNISASTDNAANFSQTMPSYSSMDSSQYSMPSYSSYGGQNPMNSSAPSYDYSHSSVPSYTSSQLYPQGLSSHPNLKSSSTVADTSQDSSYDNSGYVTKPQGYHPYRR